MLSSLKVSSVYKASMAMDNQPSRHRLDRYDSDSAKGHQNKNSSKSFKDALKSELAKNSKR